MLHNGKKLFYEIIFILLLPASYVPDYLFRMEKISIISGFLSLPLAFCCVMIGTSKAQQKQRRHWIIGAGVIIAIGAVIVISALRLPTEKAAPATQQGNCSTTGNVAGNFSPNCDNK